MKRVGYREMTWRPFLPNGRPGDPVTFEIEESEYDALAALRAQIERTPPGKSRSALIADLGNRLDLHAHFAEGLEVVVPPVTDALAGVAEAESHGFRVPAQFRSELGAGQLRMDAPGSLRPEVIQPEITDQDREVTDPDRTLSDPDRNEPGKFHADPKATEKAAAFKVLPRTGSQRRLVLDAIAASGGRGLLDEEIAVVEGVADTAHRTRRNELVMGGWVRDSGRTRRTASGTDSIAWVLTDEGLLRWAPEEVSA